MHVVKTIDKRSTDMLEGCIMFIATPKIIGEYVKCIQYGNESGIPTMPNDLAKEYQAEKNCPVIASVF